MNFNYIDETSRKITMISTGNTNINILNNIKLFIKNN